MHMINRDLLRFRAFELEHANDFAMCSNTIRAEIRRGANQENVFLLPALECSFFHDQIGGHNYFGIDHVRACCLFREKIRQKSELLPDGSKGRKVFFIIRLVAEISHGSPPKQWEHLYHEINPTATHAFHASAPLPPNSPNEHGRNNVSPAIYS